MKSRKVLLGLLAGVAAGATIGVLFANGKLSLPAKKSQERDKAMHLNSKKDSVHLFTKSKMMLSRLTTRHMEV